MISDEDFEKAIKEKPLTLIYQSVILFLAFPWIKWGFWSVLYVIIKNDWVLNKFTEATFENIIPWYLGIFINFKGSLAILLVSFLVIWIVHSFFESRE